MKSKNWLNRGQAAVEYILLLVVVTLVAIPILTQLRDELAGNQGFAAQLISGLGSTFGGSDGSFRYYTIPR